MDSEDTKLSCKHSTSLIALALFGTIMITCSAMGPWLEFNRGITYSWATPMELCIPSHNYSHDCQTHAWRDYGIKYGEDAKVVYGILTATIVTYFVLSVMFMFSCEPCPSVCLFRFYVIIEIMATIMMHIVLIFWLNCR